MSNIDSKLVQIFSSSFENSKNITIDSSFEDIEEWDSLGFAVLINNIENDFDVKFNLEDLFNFDSVKSIRDVLLKIIKS